MKIDEKMKEFKKQIAELQAEIDSFNEKYDTGFQMGWFCERMPDYDILYSSRNFEEVCVDSLHEWYSLKPADKRRVNFTISGTIDEDSFSYFDNKNEELPQALCDFFATNEKNIDLSLLEAWELQHYVNLDELSIDNDLYNNFWNAIKLLDIKECNNIDEWYHSYAYEEPIKLNELSDWTESIFLTKEYAYINLGKIANKYARLMIIFEYCNDLDMEEITYIDESEIEIIIKNMIIELC